MLRKAGLVLLGTVCGIGLSTGFTLADPLDDLGNWEKFRDIETKSQQPAANDNKPAQSGLGTGSGASASPPETVEQGAFTVPGYFAVQPQPFERPQETFTAPRSNFGNGASGLNSFAATLPFVLSGGNPYRLGYGGWGGLGYGGYSPGLSGAFAGLPARARSAGVPGFGWGGYVPGIAGLGPGLGLGGFGPGLGLGGFAPGGFAGYPGYGLGYGGFGGGLGGFGGGWGGYGYGGLGGYGWYGNPGFGSLMLGAFGGAITGSSHNGTLSGQRVFQSAPSKASGNYYAPSTADTTASGSYYATTAPAQIPAIPVKKPITNFWGPSDSASGKDTSMPWNK